MHEFEEFEELEELEEIQIYDKYLLRGLEHIKVRNKRKNKTVEYIDNYIKEDVRRCNLEI